MTGPAIEPQYHVRKIRERIRVYASAVEDLSAAITLVRSFGEAWVSLAEARACGAGVRYWDRYDLPDLETRSLAHAVELARIIDRSIEEAEEGFRNGASPMHFARVLGEASSIKGDLVRKTGGMVGVDAIDWDASTEVASAIRRLEALEERYRDHQVLMRLGQLWECLALFRSREPEADLTADLSRAIEYYTLAIERRPEFAALASARANALYELGKRELDLGRDPLSYLRRAANDDDVYLATDPGERWSRLYRGLARHLEAQYSRLRGEDPGTALDVEALRDLEGVEEYDAYVARATSRMYVALARLEEGEDVRTECERALADLEKENPLRAGDARVLRIDRGEILVALGRAKEAAGEDASGEFSRALEELRAGFRGFLGDVLREVDVLVLAGRSDLALRALARVEGPLDDRGAPGAELWARRSLARLAVILEEGASASGDPGAALDLAEAAARAIGPGNAEDSKTLAFRALAVASRTDGLDWGSLERLAWTRDLRADPRWGK